MRYTMWRMANAYLLHTVRDWQVMTLTPKRGLRSQLTLAFICQFSKITFSLGSAPATFQRLLEVVLSGLERYVCAYVVYLDDVLVFGFMIAKHNVITSIRYWNNFTMPDYP